MCCLTDRNEKRDRNIKVIIVYCHYLLFFKAIKNIAFAFKDMCVCDNYENIESVNNYKNNNSLSLWFQIFLTLDIQTYL